MDKKTFLKKHPSFIGRLKELIDNPFTAIDETQIDKKIMLEAVRKCELSPYIENMLKNELGMN